MPDLRPLSEVSWTEALSRLHPMVLHLPIAILIVLFLVELPRLFRRKPVAHDSTRSVLVVVLMLTAPITAASGYFLSAAGSYGPPVDWHQRLGIATAVVSVLAGLAYWKKSEHYPLLIVLGSALVAVTAHLGATLTHGANFLIEPWLPAKEIQHRAPLQPSDSSGTDATGEEPDTLPQPQDRDSADTADTGTGTNPSANSNTEPTQAVAPPALATPEFTFNRDVLPIFEDYCFKCHSERKQKGELRLDTYDFLLAGSEYGWIFIPGNSFESRMVEMLRLDLMEDEHMPPENKPQPEEEDIAAIEAWIDSLPSQQQ